MRCAIGDTCLVIQDFPGCEANIGMAVNVVAAAEKFPECDWTVNSRVPMMAMDPADASLFPVKIAEYPDSFLLPLRHGCVFESYGLKVLVCIEKAGLTDKSRLSKRCDIEIMKTGS